MSSDDAPEGPPDVQALIEQTQGMQGQLGELADVELTAVAGDGLVTIKMSGSGTVTQVLVEGAPASLGLAIAEATNDVLDQMKARVVGMLPPGLLG